LAPNRTRKRLVSPAHAGRSADYSSTTGS
jgi:hypothetical protein